MTLNKIVVHFVDGRVLNGVIAEEDGIRVVLKTVEQPRVVIAKTDIEQRKISPKSMMPDGQLEKMKRQLEDRISDDGKQVIDSIGEDVDFSSYSNI